MVQESEDTSMVTIYNIDVVTNYLQKDEYLMPDGRGPVRHFKRDGILRPPMGEGWAAASPMPIMSRKIVPAHRFHAPVQGDRRCRRGGAGGWRWGFLIRTDAANTYMIPLNT